MHSRLIVEERWYEVVIRVDGRSWNLYLAEPDATGDGSAIGEDPVVGHFEVVIPAVRIDAAAGLTIGEAHAIDTRCGAIEVTRLVKIDAVGNNVKSAQ